MKRIIAVLLLTAMVLTFSACAGTKNESSSQPEEESSAVNETSSPESSASETESTESVAAEESSSAEDESDEGGSNVLVSCFSRAGENYGVGVIEEGNTRIIADMIAEETGADIFEIARVTPYPEAYDATTEEAQAEKNAGARPELTGTVENFADYDVIFIGYPNWWGDMPMPVYTFLESYDFSGKTVIPFCTHAGSGLSGTVGTIRDKLSGATVLDGLAIPGTTAQNDRDTARNEVDSWLEGMDITSTMNTSTATETNTITLTSGDIVITAELDGSETSKAFLAALPQTLTMNNYDDREYYARIEALPENGENIEDFMNGDVTYYPAGPSLAVFFGKEDSSSQSGLIRMGKISSELSAFSKLADTAEVVIDLA